MRLTDQQQQIIREEVARVFGPEAGVRLFGSRVDDSLRGGDIDLYIEASGDRRELFDREMALYAALQRRLGERRIDIVVSSPEQPAREIDREARARGVPL